MKFEDLENKKSIKIYLKPFKKWARAKIETLISTKLVGDKFVDGDNVYKLTGSVNKAFDFDVRIRSQEDLDNYLTE